MPQYEGLPKLRCRDGENYLKALTRLIGPNPAPHRFRDGFWGDQPKEGERLIAAISVRPDDPDLPIFDRQPDEPLPAHLETPVLKVCQYEKRGRAGVFAVKDENGELWVVKPPEHMVLPDWDIPFVIGDTISRSLIVAGPFQSMTRAERWVIAGTPDSEPLRKEKEQL